MYDVFYQGPKPNLFPFEQPAVDLMSAADQSRTKFFWFIDGNNDYTGFDFDYCSVPWEEQFVHTWPSQWQQCGGTFFANKYTASNRQWHFKQTIVNRLANLQNWYVPEEVNAEHVDFSWHPNPLDPPYVYHFGSEYQVSIGLTYTVPGATEMKFAGPVDSNAIGVLEIFFIDKSNASAEQRYNKLAEKYQNIRRVRYANTIMDTIKRCINKTSTNKFWVISSENVYDDFNFEWHMEPWQTYMTHVFGSQWQKWSDTFLINKWEFERHSTWANSLEEFPNLNFVQDQQVHIPDDLYDIYYVDHCNNDNGGLRRIQDRYSKVKSTRYVNSYLDTFKRIMATATTDYVWIISSLCDYNRFDFSWQPEPWQKEMIHVFPSANQSRGDTFYIHVESFKKQMVELDMLDWFNVINYCEEQRVPRLPIPYVTYEGDDLISVIKQHEFTHPYTWFTLGIRDIVYNPSIWGEKDKKIVSFSPGNSTVLVPRESKNYINAQAYDYPYISKLLMFLDTPLDIVYISNGEPDAERWYNHLIDCVDTSRRVVHRVANVNGRSLAYKAAAELSRTPWFFAVFAKIEVNPEFEWDWQPDYLQEPKHYVFHSRNPVNGLEYGHMGVIAYNKRLVLETDSPGLDFTLSKPHAVVPVVSATAHYNTTPELTWRTAFREVLKLKDDVEKTASIESNYRLSTWLTTADGTHGGWSIKGAEDAVEYYESVSGDYDLLMLSFEWQWLKDYFSTRYNQ